MLLLCVATIAALLGTGVAVTAVRAAGYPAFWRDRANELIPADALRLIALGDSSMVGVGTLDPMNGIAGRVARDLEQQTGRPVHITNLAVSGSTTAQMLREQLPQAPLATADIVIVSTPSDMESRVPLDEYRRDVDQLTALLPADRTVISDLPLEPGRDSYQAILTQSTDNASIARADFATVFNGHGRRLDIFSLLPPHLNDRGYNFWSTAFQDPTRRIVRRGPTSG
nr:SGNH/GDSL hydrolase family protein [Rathayibacter caricis]